MRDPVYILGIHDGLAEVSRSLRPGEDLCAFLDDVYALCKPERARPIYNMLEHALSKHAGIEVHTGKTKVWHRAGRLPPDIGHLGGEEGAWSRNSGIILGAPVGNADFVRAHAAERWPCWTRSLSCRMRSALGNS